MLISKFGRRIHQSNNSAVPALTRYAMLVLVQLTVLIAFLLSAPSASASAGDIYISNSGGGDGSSCGSPQGVSFFNNSASWGSGSNQIGPGTTVHLCGTFNGAANSNMLTVRGDGTSGNNITILFESGAQLNAPYWSSGNGAINISNRKFITIDGGANGIIQNTANGDLLANRQITTLVYAMSCTNCTVRNLTLANAYVTVKNQSTLGGPMTQMAAVVLSGSNWVINNNKIHDCGWCLYNIYGNGDTNINVYQNDIANWDHAYMFATSGANHGSNFQFHDNKVHDNINFETPDCKYHLDGIHFFGTSGSSMSEIYVYNNYFYGALSGACSSGFIFMEGGTGTPSHASNSYFWNNVFDATGSDGVNPNGWVGIFSGDSGETFVTHNTLLYKNSVDSTNCFNVGSVNNLTFKGNVVNGCTIAANIGSLKNTPASQIDYNFYGDACNGSNNCFIYNGSFMGSFGNWKSSSGFDAHSKTSSYSGALLNADGSPQAGSPVVGSGANLLSEAVSSLVSLSRDTSRGGGRTPILRPVSGAWDMGAYQFGTSSGSQATVAAPTGLSASAQ